ncbi:MAG TPA: Gfo/Idh/MocA family oxidoreductase [Chloroflexota bacterium]|nr:Gfo/Idh/MocA family oxidoreductase [Chloroflexota bacterium]
MTEQPLRIVQVGAAPTGIGTTWLSSIQRAADWQLAGLVDVVPDHRAQAAARAGLDADRCFGSIAEATQALDFDAAVIVAPSPLHGDLCRQALEAGKHAIVEKPFTLDFAQARAVAALADGRGLRLMVDQNYRYMPDLQALRRAVREEVAGRPTFVSLTFYCDWPPRTYQTAMANTMLLEMAIHHFDALRFVLESEPRTVSGQTWRPPWTRYQGDTWVNGAFTFDNDVRAAYCGSLEAPGKRDPWQGVWRVECERGALHLADLGAGYGLYRSRSLDAVEPLEIFGAPADPGSAIQGTLAEFAAALRAGRRPQSDGRDNLRTLAMAFAVSRSSAEGRPIDLMHEFFADREADR